MIYNNIRVHFVHCVNHYGYHKARLVSDENLTDIPVKIIDSGFVYLQIRFLFVFISKLN